MDELLTPPEGDKDPDNYLETLVGDGKKFASVEELAKGKYHADRTIEVLTKRMDELRDYTLQLREENTSRAKLEELIDQLSNRQENSKLPNAKEDQPTFDPKQLETLVSKQLQEIESNKKETNNLDEVRSKLRETFGDKANEVLKQRSKDLGLSDGDLIALAKKSPAAFFKTIEVETSQERFQSPPRSSQRNDSFSPKGSPKRTWAYYQELKKSNPQLYLDREIAIQMQKDASELGEAFNDGDFHRFG